MSERDVHDLRPGSIHFASRMLRRGIIVLMVLVPLSAIYAFVFGGIAAAPQRDVFFFRTGSPAPFTMPLPPSGVGAGAGKAFEFFGPPFFGAPPGPFMPREEGQRIVTTRCDEKDGVRTCTTTERPVQPGETLPAPALSPGSTAPAPAGASPSVKPIAFMQWVAASEEKIQRAETPNPVRTFEMPARDIVRGAVGGALLLSVASLLLLIGVLYNFERMLAAFETGAVFSPEIVKRLQHAGLFVSAAAFFPQLDLYALIRDALISVMTFSPMVPMPGAFAENINIPLLLAGLFTILVARIVDEAVWLADEVRATI